MDTIKEATKQSVRNQFITNILGTSSHYSPEIFMKLNRMLPREAVSCSCDLFRVAVPSRK